MSKNDELTDQVSAIAAEFADQFYCFARYETPPKWTNESVATDIIALVRADERRKLREALLSGKSLVAAVDAGYQHRPNLPAHYRATTEAQLAAIGLSESEVAE